MVIDVVLYSGERELLDARVDILKADRTIVVEGDKSFTGKPKKIETLPKNLDHLKLEVGQDPDPWVNEKKLRQDSFDYLKTLDLPDDTIVGFFDVDEIPDPELLRGTTILSAWKMSKYQMSLFWYQHKELTGLSGSWANIKNEDIPSLRWKREFLPCVEGGYHLSSFMTLELLIEKWQHISHQELVRPNMEEWLRHCWYNGIAVENENPLTEQEPEGIPKRLLELPSVFMRKREKIAK